MKFAILTDSSCNLPEHIINTFDIQVLPLNFMIDGVSYKSYMKGRHFDFHDFYNQLREGTPIKTSLPNMAESEKTIREILDKGQDLLYIGFSSGLSGTFESTSLMMRMMSPEYPGRTLLASDTLAASLGQGMLVYHAARLREEGASIHEVFSWLERYKYKVAHWFVVGDLKYLSRGGRLAKGAAKIGSMLSIKPVLHEDDEGHLIPMEVVRGRKKSLNALLDHMEESADTPLANQIIYIVHGDCIHDAEYLAHQIEMRFGASVSLMEYIEPVIGSHTGPDTVGLFFMADKR